MPLGASARLTDLLRFPLCWLRGQVKFRSVEAAADALCGWLRATCKPDDYTIYITLPDSILPPSPLQLGVATTQKQMNELKDFFVAWDGEFETAERKGNG